MGIIECYLWHITYLHTVHMINNVFPSERQEQQLLRAATTSPSTIRLTWRIIQSSRGYRLEWREGEGQMSMSRARSHILLSLLYSFCTLHVAFCSSKMGFATWTSYYYDHRKLFKDLISNLILWRILIHLICVNIDNSYVYCIRITHLLFYYYMIWLTYSQIMY